MDNDPTTPRYVHDSSDDSDYDNGTPDLPSSSSEENLPSDFPVSINKQPIHEQPIYEQPINYPHHPSYPPSSSDVITKEITQLKDEISEKDELIKQLKQKIVQLDNIASEKDNVITKSEYEIAQLKEEISEKDNIIMHSEYKITQLEKKASVTDRTPKSLNKTIPLNVEICRIHWFTMPVTININNKKIEIHKPSLKERRVIEGQQVTFIQDDFDFIPLKKPNKEFDSAQSKKPFNELDRLCVVDLTYCQGNTIDIHTPNGVIRKKQEFKNGDILTMNDIISENVNGRMQKGTFYVSFVKSGVKRNGFFIQNVFDYGANPSFYENKSFSYQNCDVSIPSNHNKDVYYYEHQDRQELFGQSNYHTIPVYFPIPVLRDRNTYSVFFEIFPRYDKSYFVRICVTICYSSNLDPGALPNLSKLRKPS